MPSSSIKRPITLMSQGQEKKMMSERGGVCCVKTESSLGFFLIITLLSLPLSITHTHTHAQTQTVYPIYNQRVTLYRISQHAAITK